MTDQQRADIERFLDMEPHIADASLGTVLWRATAHEGMDGLLLIDRLMLAAGLDPTSKQIDRTPDGRLRIRGRPPSGARVLVRRLRRRLTRRSGL